MYQALEQSRDERIKMYMRCTKRELVEMLVNANDELNRIGNNITIMRNVRLITDNNVFGQGHKISSAGREWG